MNSGAPSPHTHTHINIEFNEIPTEKVVNGTTRMSYRAFKIPNVKITNNIVTTIINNNNNRQKKQKTKKRDLVFTRRRQFTFPLSPAGAFCSSDSEWRTRARVSPTTPNRARARDNKYASPSPCDFCSSGKVQRGRRESIFKIVREDILYFFSFLYTQFTRARLTITRSCVICRGVHEPCIFIHRRRQLRPFLLFTIFRSFSLSL